MTYFKYDVPTFIELVKSKPCLWDKTNENYKHKLYRDKCWQDIFEALDDEYDQMTQAEKKRTGDIIMAKWTNVRDAYFRSLKTKYGNDKKPYKYGEELQFLLTGQDSEKRHFRENVRGESDELAESQVPTPAIKSVSLKHSASALEENLRKPKRRAEHLGRLLEPRDRNTSPSRNPLSERDILLLSFLPYIRDMNVTELLDFQMDVLSIIKKIKDRRKDMPENNV